MKIQKITRFQISENFTIDKCTHLKKVIIQTDIINCSITGSISNISFGTSTIQNLSIYSYNIDNMEGFKYIQKLSELFLINCKKIRNMDWLQDQSYLRKMNVLLCPLFNGQNIYPKLHSLCIDSDSIHAIKNLKKLKKFGFFLNDYDYDSPSYTLDAIIFKQTPNVEIITIGHALITNMYYLEELKNLRDMHLESTCNFITSEKDLECIKRLKNSVCIEGI